MNDHTLKYEWCVYSAFIFFCTDYILLTFFVTYFNWILFACILFIYEIFKLLCKYIYNALLPDHAYWLDWNGSTFTFLPPIWFLMLSSLTLCRNYLSLSRIQYSLVFFIFVFNHILFCIGTARTWWDEGMFFFVYVHWKYATKNHSALNLIGVFLKIEFFYTFLHFHSTFHYKINRQENYIAKLPLKHKFKLNYKAL